MKTIVSIEPISGFEFKSDCKVRTEIEYYSDGTSSIVIAQYFLQSNL